MKKTLSIIGLFCSLATGLALQHAVFSSWDDLIQNTSHIMIISTSKCSYSVNGVATSEAKVISVLKGDGKPNMSLHLRTTYFPYDGERLLIFFNGGLDQTNAEFDALGFCVVPIHRFFPVDRLLAGKNLKEQIGILLKSRLRDLNDEMASDKAEEAQLETFFSNEKSGTNALNNAPLQFQTNAPARR